MLCFKIGLLLKIAFIRRNWSPTGGAENYLVRLVNHIKASGFHATLLCESWKRDIEPFDEIATLPVSGPAFLKPARFASLANQYLENHSFDVVFSLERGIRSDIYRAGDGVHLSWLDHRLSESPVLGRLRNFFNPKNQVLKHLEMLTFHPSNTRLVIANSELVRDEILRFFDFPENRIRVVPNGVDVAYFSSGDRAAGRKALGWGDDEFVALLVGAGAERKGHAAARRVEARLNGKLRLHIVDKPALCPLPDLYAAADIFLFPTLYDPFANVTLEAMAAGLPVITTTCNGASQIIVSGQNGYVVRDSRETDTMSAYALALQDPELRKRIGHAARKTAGEYTLERNVKETLAVLKEVAK